MTEQSFENSQLIRIWTQVVVRVIAIILLVLGAAWLLYHLSTLLLLLVISVFFCYLIAPLVRLFEQPIYVGGRELRLPRSIAIAVVYVLIGGALFFGLKLIWPQLSAQVAELRRNWDEYIKSGSNAASNFISGANTWMRRLGLPPQWRDYMTDHVGELAKSSVPKVEAVVAEIVSFIPYLSWLVIVPILSFFFLRDAESFATTAVALLPNERLRKRARWLLLDVSQTMAAYIRAQITSCIVVGTLATIGLYLLGAPYPVVLGSVIAVCEFVPLAGPLLGAFTAFGLTLTLSIKTGLWVAAFLIVLRIVQDYIIYPRIVGFGIKMHPLLVVLAIFGGAELGGLVGIFLAVPVVALIIVAYNHYLAYRGIQKLNIVMSGGEAAQESQVQITTESAAQGD